MKFKIWNTEYMPNWVGFTYNSLTHIGINIKYKWVVKTPTGKTYREASHEDAVKRMNIILNEVPS